jgi:hypothetical protein
MYFIEKTKSKAMDFYAGDWWIKGGGIPKKPSGF